jgi:hypothetical protein
MGFWDLTNDFAGDFQELASRWLMGNGLSQWSKNEEQATIDSLRV